MAPIRPHSTGSVTGFEIQITAYIHGDKCQINKQLIVDNEEASDALWCEDGASSLDMLMIEIGEIVSMLVSGNHVYKDRCGPISIEHLAQVFKSSAAPITLTRRGTAYSQRSTNND